MDLQALLTRLREEPPDGRNLIGAAVQSLADVVGNEPVALVGVPSGGMASVAFEHGVPGADGWMTDADGLPGMARLRQLQTWQADAESEGEGWPSRWPRPTAAVPIASEGACGGALYWMGSNASADVLLALEAVGVYLSLVLERDRLTRELHRSDRQLAQMLSITAEIGRQHDFGELVQHIVDGLTASTDFRVATITLREGDTCRRLAASGLANPRTGLTTPFASWRGLLQPSWRVGAISFLVPPEAEAQWSDIPDIAPSDDPNAWSADHALVITLLDAEDDIVGFLSVDEPRSGRLPDSRTVEGLELFARQVQVAFVNARLYAELRHAAERDSLTGLLNRRSLWAALPDLLRDAGPDHPLALSIIDIDDFKDINDAHGHAVGDAVLRHVADRLLRSCREVDGVYRVGGEEFVLTLPSTSGPQARAVLERVHSAIRDVRADVPGVTVSAGVAVAPVDAQDGDGLLAAADAALYEVKRAGKNRTHLASD
jgi:diguanylate cyclase (GGDEF)-like protein